jgi:3-oxoacyl-[acyl-carrier protein] reductase
MDLQLKGKTALVTGASMGIGRAIAKALAAEGVQVVAAARRIELMETMADEVEASQHPRPILVKQDVMEEDAAARLSGAALQALGRIDILVNNAGGSRVLPIDAPEERWTEAMTLNFTRPRQLCCRR